MQDATGWGVYYTSAGVHQEPQTLHDPNTQVKMLCGDSNHTGCCSLRQWRRQLQLEAVLEHSTLWAVPRRN